MAISFGIAEAISRLQRSTPASGTTWPCRRSGPLASPDGGYFFRAKLARGQMIKNYLGCPFHHHP